MLANGDVTDLYTISVADWEAIDKRVNNVFRLRNIENVVSRTIPGYPDLLASSELWVDYTFNSLIVQSAEVVSYAERAIADFTALNNAVQTIQGDVIPPAIQNQTRTVLSSLSDSTSRITQEVYGSSAQVTNFMQDNQVVDAEMAQNSGALGIFWEPLGKIITDVEHATGKVNGAWKAVGDDIGIAVSKDIHVDMPFIMSLDIDASIVLWTEIAKEAKAFPKQVQEIGFFLP